MASSHLIYLGTYTRHGDSQGIYAVRLDSDSGGLSAPVLVAEATDPTWITLSPDRKFLYAPHGSASQAIGFAADPSGPKLTPLPRGRAEPPTVSVHPPSFLATDRTGRVLLAANYHESFVSAMPIHSDGTLGPATTYRHEGRGVHPTRQEKPHIHSVTVSPDNQFVIVADLGLDKIFSYRLDPASATLTPANPAFVATEPGAGPRHFKFGINGRHAYAINELNNTVTVYDYDATCGALTPIETHPTLPAGSDAPNKAAEVRIHPSGAFLYASNRGHDSLAVFAIEAASGRLTPLELIPSGGEAPRNFALSPDGRWLVCGHQDTPRVTVFRVDPHTGRLNRTPHTAPVPACVCVLFYD